MVTITSFHGLLPSVLMEKSVQGGSVELTDICGWTGAATKGGFSVFWSCLIRLLLPSCVLILHCTQALSHVSVCLIHAADRNQNSLLLEVKWADTSPVTVTFVGICEFWKYFLAVMPHFQFFFNMMQWKTSRSNFRFLFPFLKCSCFNQQ